MKASHQLAKHNSSGEIKDTNAITSSCNAELSVQKTEHSQWSNSISGIGSLSFVFLNPSRSCSFLDQIPTFFWGRHVPLWLVLWSARIAGPMAEGGQDSFLGSRQCWQDHPSSHVERRGGFCLSLPISLYLLVIMFSENVGKMGFLFVAETSATPADPAPHVGGAEYWENKVQGFRFGWPPDRSQSLERLLC